MEMRLKILVKESDFCIKRFNNHLLMKVQQFPFFTSASLVCALIALENAEFLQWNAIFSLLCARKTTNHMANQ